MFKINQQALGLLTIGAILVSALQGCTGLKSPDVDIINVTLGEVTSEGYVLDFSIALANPNSEPLELHEFAYRVNINGSSVYQGRRSAEATISARGGKTVTIPAVIRFDQTGVDQVPQSATYSITGTLWYLSPGTLAEIFFDSGVDRPSIAFNKAGELTFANSE